jgi:hypothetical protein
MRETMLIAALLLAAAVAGCGNVSHNAEMLPVRDDLVLPPNEAIVRADAAAEVYEAGQKKNAAVGGELPRSITTCLAGGDQAVSTHSTLALRRGQAQESKNVQ